MVLSLYTLRSSTATGKSLAQSKSQLLFNVLCYCDQRSGKMQEWPAEGWAPTCFQWHLWLVGWLVKSSVKPWSWGRSQTLERWRTFTPWRSCLAEKILLKSVAAKASRHIIQLYVQFLLKTEMSNVTGGNTKNGRRNTYPKAALNTQHPGWRGPNIPWRNGNEPWRLLMD
jgi:hypothetical protein